VLDGQHRYLLSRSASVHGTGVDNTGEISPVSGRARPQPFRPKISGDSHLEDVLLGGDACQATVTAISGKKES